ncbi:hypothetical protein AEB_P0863 [Altererythrobacter sp. B11]|nr:hypothetical protein AEB_P0863 [Altererythrobacter sp. B11]
MQETARIAQFIQLRAPSGTQEDLLRKIAGVLVTDLALQVSQHSGTLIPVESFEQAAARKRCPCGLR